MKSRVVGTYTTQVSISGTEDKKFTSQDDNIKVT